MAGKGTIKKIKINIFIIIGLIGALVFFEYSKQYMHEKKVKYEKKLEIVRVISKEEKDWIRKNQGISGEIYQNYEKGVGDVNPYFACLAAQGLLAGQPTDEDMDSVKRYLLWHKEYFLKDKGEISNYRLVKDQLISMEEKDSVDSYTAVFLSLLCQYAEKGGDVRQIDSDGSLLWFGMEKLKTLITNGLTAVSEETRVYYLMDNLEVQKAFWDVKSFLEQYGEMYADKKEVGLWIVEVNDLIKSNEESIEGLWNQEEQRYEVGLGKNQQILKFKGWEQKYPDAVAQVYSMAFLGNEKNKKRNKILYDKFCKEHTWETLDISEEDFIWANISFIAATINDRDRAETYLKQYVKRVNKSRAYPLYTAEVGWIVKTCDRLEEEYKTILKRNIFEDMFEWIKEQIL